MDIIYNLINITSIPILNVGNIDGATDTEKRPTDTELCICHL